jgi:hypothetical protein
MRYLIFCLILFSCTKEVRYSKEDLLKRAQAADSSVQLIIPKIEGSIHCSDYSPPCMTAHIVSVKGLELLALEYPSEAEAIAAAKKYRGYYTGNWFFDDVAGEPVLENFIQKHLDAKKP